jgi:hypothetical protein
MVDTIRMDRQWYGNVRDIWLEEETAEMVIEVSRLQFPSLLPLPSDIGSVDKG